MQRFETTREKFVFDESLFVNTPSGSVAIGRVVIDVLCDITIGNMLRNVRFRDSGRSLSAKIVPHVAELRALDAVVPVANGPQNVNVVGSRDPDGKSAEALKAPALNLTELVERHQLKIIYL